MRRPAMGRAGVSSARHGDAAEVLGAVVIGNEVDGLAVRGEARGADVAVKGQGEDLGFAAGSRSDGQMGSAVFEQLRLQLSDVGDPLPVGRPGRGAILAWIGRYLGEVRALVGIVR